MKGSTIKDFSFRKKQIPLKLAVMLSKTFRKKITFCATRVLHQIYIEAHV